MAVYKMPDTNDPDFGKSCMHYCDTNDFGNAAQYDNRTRRLTIIPHNFEIARDFVMRCEILDRGYP
jgi:hypothetical protein